jgi:anthranilate synthase component 1
MGIFPEINEFSTEFAKGKAQVIYSKISSDMFTPVAVMSKLQDEYEYCFLLESVQGGAVRGRYSIIGLGQKFLWKAEGKKAFLDGVEQKEDALVSLKNLIRDNTLKTPKELPPMATGVFGYLGYDTIRLFENIPDKNKDELGIPDAMLFMPEIVLVFDAVQDSLFLCVTSFAGKGTAEESYNAACKLILQIAEKINAPVKISPNRPKEKEIKFTSNCTRESYYGMVNKAKEYITAGDIFQLVPSQRFTADFDLPPFAFYRSLRALNPSPYLFFLKLKDFHITGSSPEILVRLKDEKVTIRPIAGTRKRGANTAEDEALKADLLSDQKELSEHLMLLDLGRNDVGRVAESGSVKVTEKMLVELYSHVMHIVSNVEGKIAKGKDAVDALAAGFPAGTVSGAPKIRAMEIIDELENVKRKFYGGAVGYFSGDQMDSCIALRTALIKDNKLYLQAGGGVVADSDPEAEYQETINKAKALMRAAEKASEFI